MRPLMFSAFCFMKVMKVLFQHGFMNFRAGDCFICEKQDLKKGKVYFFHIFLLNSAAICIPYVRTLRMLRGFPALNLDFWLCYFQTGN